MPPKPGAIAVTAATISSASFVARQIGHASTPPNSLNSIALPSITGIAASGPMSPRPSTAVPSLTTATVLLLDRQVPDLGRVARRSPCRRAPRRACRPSRGRRASSAATSTPSRSCRRGAAGTCGRRRARPRRPASACTAATICSRWSALAGVDGDVAHLLARLDADEVDRAEAAAGVADRARPGRRTRPGRSSRCTRSVALNEAEGRGAHRGHRLRNRPRRNDGGPRRRGPPVCAAAIVSATCRRRSGSRGRGPASAGPGSCGRPSRRRSRSRSRRRPARAAARRSPTHRGPAGSRARSSPSARP